MEQIILQVVIILGIIIAGGFLIFFLGDLLMSIVDPKRENEKVKAKKKGEVKKFAQKVETLPEEVKEEVLKDETVAEVVKEAEKVEEPVQEEPAENLTVEAYVPEEEKVEEEEDDEEEEPLPDGVERDMKPAHLEASKLTFIGEGDSVNLIMKHRLNLCDAPEDFILNTGSIRLIEHVHKLAGPKTHIFLIEFGEDIKYPVLTLEDGQINYSQHFGVLKQVAQKLGYTAQSHYWMEEIGVVRDMDMFATTRSQFKAMRQMLGEHGVELERRAYSREEFSALLERAGRTAVVEVNYEHAEDRISGLVPHAYKVLHMYHEEEVGTDIGGLEI